MPETLGTIVAETLKGLGDPGAGVWTVEEIAGYVREGYQQLALQGRVFLDALYAENLPAGFSVTAAVDEADADFQFGVANYTFDDERRLVTPERSAVGWANYTSPCEATGGWLDDCGAATTIRATTELPATVTEIARGTWDERTMTALDGRAIARTDTRYEITRGEVYGFLWRKDGVRTLRKVRVPAAAAATVTAEGSWGGLRDPADLSDETVVPETGPVGFQANAFSDAFFTDPTHVAVRGLPRQIPGEHPIGPESFGAPRRPYRDRTNVRIEHWRHGRALTAAADVCELPDRYARYLRDYARAQALRRPGAGYNAELAAHYETRWNRGLARVTRRQQAVERERVGVLGGPPSGFGRRPPRARLPWQFGARVR
jgi:hypothetical protein